MGILTATPNSTVTQTAKQASQFFDTLQAQQQIAFQGNQAALGAISKAWAPVLSSGVVPYGYSSGLDNLLKANVIDTGAQGTTNAMNAEALRQKQESGGANVLPTGANAQIDATIQALGQQKTAAGLQAEKIAGYDQGLKNLEGGTQAELGVASAENETGLASGANSAGDLALNAGTEEFKEAQQPGLFHQIMGAINDGAQAIGSVAGAVTGIGDIGASFKNFGKGGGGSGGGDD